MGQKCIHCGADCGTNPVIWDEMPFCCHGCKTVYQILNEKKLDKYYEIQPMSGVKIENVNLGNKYAYLDNNEIADKLIEFSDGGISRVSLYIPSIHCASCIWLLENLRTLNKGILQSMVNFPKKKVSITYKPSEISIRQLVELLASIHYIPEITLDQLDDKKNKKTDRKLISKIGVAGFSLLNVMVYNFPEYLPGKEHLSTEFVKFFGWMSILLSIPVVFYSASDYYQSAIKGLKHKIINIDVPISLGIFTLFIQSFYDVFLGHGIGYLDSLVGLVFFLLIGKWYQTKTYNALSFDRNYKSYFPIAITIVKSDLSEEIIPMSKLKVGNEIIIRNQELIPADSILISDTANIDYSFVTGESIPVGKKRGEVIYAGGRQVGPAIRLKVEKTVEQSYLTQLWNQDSEKNINSNLDSVINKVSNYFTIVILTIASISGIYWWLTDPSIALFAFTSVLIIACPCALALTIPFTFGNTMRVFGKAGFYIKNTSVIDGLHKIDTIVFDKTGTITHSKSMKAVFVGDKLNKNSLLLIKSLVSQSAHPLSLSIAASIHGNPQAMVENFQEIPSMGITGAVNGVRINIGSRKFVTGKEDENPNETRVYVFIKDHISGYFKIENKYRSGLDKVVRSLKLKYKLYLISGDNESEKTNLKQIFGKETKLFFNQSPTDKKAFIRKLKKEGRRVMMIGDGLNDAGALLESDIGITIADDVYQFSPACDGIIESDSFYKLHKYLRFINYSMNIVRISFILSFIYNIVGISFAVSGHMTPLLAAVLMPVSSVSVVAFVTFFIRFKGKSLKK